MKVFERAQALIDYTMIITDNTDRANITTYLQKEI